MKVSKFVDTIYQHFYCPKWIFTKLLSVVLRLLFSLKQGKEKY